MKLYIIVVLLAAGPLTFTHKRSTDDRFISYTLDPNVQDLRFYWKDDSGQVLGSIQHLKDYLGHQHKKLVFAMNGGMFKADHSPVGLFIQQQKTITPLDRSTGEGNFYLKPNGVFYITMENKAVICQTQDFMDNGRIRYATQSGPLLLMDGSIHPAFKKGSANVNIRNGVGVLPGNKLVFVLSKTAINFYDFAEYFKTLGCRNALYLDGFVSRAYLPEKDWEQTDGNFGVLLGVSMPLTRTSVLRSPAHPPR